MSEGREPTLYGRTGTMPETGVMSLWSEFEPAIVDQLLGVINNDPQVLLETDGGPVGAKADVVLAVLYGMDEQVDAYWRLRGPVPAVLRRPIQRRVTMASFDDDPTSLSVLAADYHLQSSFAHTTIADPHLLPSDVRLGGPTFEATVLLVRYRRHA